MSRGHWRAYRGIEAGDRAFVATDSWAGRTLHAVRVLALCPARARVEWLDAVPKHARGSVSYVPLEALRAETIGTLSQRLAQVRR